MSETPKKKLESRLEAESVLLIGKESFCQRVQPSILGYGPGYKAHFVLGGSFLGSARSYCSSVASRLIVIARVVVFVLRTVLLLSARSPVTIDHASNLAA